jgi:GNAT superfamily N-acetyltransferase
MGVVIRRAGARLLRPGRAPEDELEYLFVEPEAIGGGHGRRLWQHAIATAREAGVCRLIIQSGPGSDGFSLAMGAERTGPSPSGSIPGRELPRLRYSPRIT